MPVNVLTREETDETRIVFGPGLVLPMMEADTFDVDAVPQPLSPWMRHVSQAQVLSAAPARHLVTDLQAFGRCPHHYCGWRGGGGTVFPVQTNMYVQSTHLVAGVLTLCYHSLSSTAEQELSLPQLNACSPETPPNSLADYDAYSVDNWDGYDALPITTDTLHVARSVLRSLPNTFGDPVCSPGADGSIVFEWLMDEGPLRKLFIDIGPGRTWKAYWRLANGKVGTVPRKAVTIGTIPELRKLFETLFRG